jgi:hypothetical protein
VGYQTSDTRDSQNLPVFAVASIIGAGGHPMSVATVQPEFVTLYRRAFADYRTHALWYMRAFDKPTPDDALAVARALRINGDLPARRLAEQIEQACRFLS